MNSDAGLGGTDRANHRDFLDRIFPFPLEKVVFRIAETGLPLAVIVIAAVALMVVPLIHLRGFHFEEGLTVGLARDAMNGGAWYVPELFGFRFMERPVLLSWIIALISLPIGDVPQIVARIPVAVSLFGGAALIVLVLRPYVSRAAALFAALCFLFSPNVLAKVVTAESDVALSVVQFGAFVLWWRSHETGRSSLLRWLCIGILLAATALFKGPQPAAYFALGVGAYIVLNREWKQLPGYVFSGAISLGILGFWYWLVFEPRDTAGMVAYMRLASSLTFGEYVLERFQFLANVLMQFGAAGLVAGGGLILWRRGLLPPLDERQRRFVIALSLYGGIALAVLTFWPGARVRYGMPALLPVACIAGLYFEAMVHKGFRLARVAMTVLLALVAYQVVWGWLAAPLFSDQFDRSRRAADTLRNVTSVNPYVIYAPVRTDDSILAYLNRPVRYLPTGELLQIDAPAYLLSPAHVADRFREERPDLTLILHAVVRNKAPLGIYEIR